MLLNIFWGTVYTVFQDFLINRKLVGWLIGWLVGWLVGWMVGCMDGSILTSCLEIFGPHCGDYTFV